MVDLVKIKKPEKADTQSESSNEIISDLNTRLKDLESKNSTIKDRTILLGENLISTKEKIDEELIDLKRLLKSLEKKINQNEKLLQSLIPETDKMIRRDEMVLVEKMLRDFQPLEFMRKKDVEEMIEQKLIKDQNSTN